MGDGYPMVYICVCVAIYDGCLVGMVEDVGIWYGWKNGFWKLVGYIEGLWI